MIHHFGEGRLALLLLVLAACSPARKGPADGPPPLAEGELAALAHLSNPADQSDSRAGCQNGCSVSGTCQPVGARWLCVVRCDRDDQCLAPKRCLCGDRKRCSVHLYDVFKSSDPHVCVVDKLGMDAPDVQRLLRGNKQ
jgi:hypothetical protein